MKGNKMSELKFQRRSSEEEPVEIKENTTAPEENPAEYAAYSEEDFSEPEEECREPEEEYREADEQAPPTQEKKKKKGLPTAAFVIIMVVLVGVFSYSAYRLIDYEIQTAKSDRADEELMQYKPDMSNIEFDNDSQGGADGQGRIPIPSSSSSGTGVKVIEVKNQAIVDMKARNKDFIGWLNVKDTKIDFAFAHTEKPGYDGRIGEYYLYKDINQEYSISGSVFLDYRNDPDFKDAVSLLYGHHMQKSAKFTYTDAFVDKNYMLEHQDLTIMLEDRYIRGKIFAYCIARANQYETFSKDIFDDPTVFLDFIKNNSTVYLDNDFDVHDKYIVLVTCNYNINNGRAVIVAGVRDPDRKDK